ncbi:ABC transporter ATP-binding protein [Polaromonas sp. C04]|uniref:ABC transporter ATP-binding protein n=1 Tax=Polaromonas sp. C04 TaxID=1945857 RepID=UPI000984590B|nr:ABC transporter ATP-binding protein [Polaromonas sp. C04]OOG51196.1 ABC transporter ATP-binding protein [Polaromonas sp. C04]
MTLEVRNLSKSFGGLRAVSDVSITVRPGTIHSILGPNGAGKTTLFNVVTGALPPTSGSVHLMGVDVTGRRPDELVYKGLARTFQRTSIFPSVTVAQNVALALRSRMKLNTSMRVDGDARQLIESETLRVLGAVGLASQAHTTAGQLSHGSQHALDIAIGLALSPKFLLMDEPLAGMSRGDRERIASVIRSLRDEHQLTVVLVEHDVDIVMRLSDTITVMQNGAVIAEDEPLAIQKSPIVKRAYLSGEIAA